jgi:hypothetical protein
MKKGVKINVKSGGGNVFLDKVKNQGIIMGRTDIHNTRADVQEVARLFNNLYKKIDRDSKLSSEDKEDLKAEIEELRKELGKKEKANEGFLLRRLRNIKRMAPDIVEVTLAIIANKAVGLGIIAKKIAEKMKSTA